MRDTGGLSDIDYTVRDQERMSRARNYFAWQGRLVRPAVGRRVVEIGCGIGNFTSMLLDRELVVGVDEVPDCLALLQARYPHVSVVECDAASAAMRQLSRFEPDSCVALNVLEHIEDDLGALTHWAAMLPAGGRIVLLVPAFPALFGPIDRHLGHYRRYTRCTLAGLARGAGLRVRELRYFNSIGFFGWWANARLWRREEQSDAQIAFFDRFVVPVLSRAEGIVAPPFGQSLFAVLEVPTSATAR